MGFMDSLKKATGVGLSPEDQYKRVYEKAILLGESNYGKAVGMFAKAAEAAAKAGNDELETHARANAAYYAFVSSGSSEHLAPLRDHLSSLDEIERIGSATETMPAAPLLAELEARLTELEVESVPSRDLTGRSAAHNRAASAFKKIFTADLVTYAYHCPDAHSATGQARFFYHSGMACWHDAVVVAGRTPEGAAEHMAKALNFFRQCNDESWADRAQVWLKNCRLKRTCWMCHREMQGADLHFKTYSADLLPYVESVLQTLGQDASTIDVPNDRLVLCKPCGSTVENLADLYATQRTQELREEVQGALDQMNRTMSDLRDAVVTLSNRLQAVERVAHRH